jgi:hypothetical protein
LEVKKLEFTEILRIKIWATLSVVLKINYN